MKATDVKSGSQEDLASLEARFEALVQRQPDAAQNWVELGRARKTLRGNAAALETYHAALAAGVPEKTIAFEYASALSEAGQHPEAERVVRSMLGRRREFFWVNFLGVVLRRARRFKEAIPLFEEARKLSAKSVAPWTNLGNCYFDLADHVRAANAFDRAARLEPKNPENWRLLGRAQHRAGRTTEALASFRRALSLAPNSINCLLDLAGTLVQARQESAALEVVAKARALQPGNAALRTGHARLLYQMGRGQEAISLLAEVLREYPDNDEALHVMARLHEGDRRKANVYYRRLYALHPDLPAAAADLCDSLNRSRHDSEAAHIQEAYEIACAAIDRFGSAMRRHAKPLRGVLGRCVDFPRFAATGSLDELAPMWLELDEIAALHHELGAVTDLASRRKMVEWHRAWGKRTAAHARVLVPGQAPAFHGGRKLRIGLMSSDLRQHPVGKFAAPLLEFNPDRIELYCYSFYEGEPDPGQRFYQSKVTAFRSWPGRPVEEVAQGIAADKLDILFELGGSTAMNKLEVMAYHPARVTASWLGYPHSAGLETIDRIVVDPYIEPPEPGLLIERPLRLPKSWVVMSPTAFQAVDIAPEPPLDRKKHITFGTMNNPYKYNPAVLDAWAAIMRGMPGSRFLFVRPEAGVAGFRANILREFGERGIEPDRVEFEAVRGTHLPHYNSIDIALDTFPHVGGTTTCETLWMGVPTVTLVGPAFFERMSYSNLSNAGLGDLCARDASEYVTLAVALAGDAPRLRSLRTGLRPQILRSPLGDSLSWVRAFYGAAAQAASE